MHYEFPYFEGRPHIPIILHYKNNSVRFLPLLDTGADYSVFYKADAVRLGIDLNKGKEISLCYFRAQNF